MPRFLHVGFVGLGLPKAKELEAVFNTWALDWVRYSTSNWILWTNDTPNQFYNRIAPHLTVQEQVLVSELDRNIGTSQGWLSKFIWDWINKTRL